MNNLLQRLVCANGMNSILCKKAADEIKLLRAQVAERDETIASLTADNRHPSSKQYDSEEWIEPN